MAFGIDVASLECALPRDGNIVACSDCAIGKGADMLTNPTPLDGCTKSVDERPFGHSKEGRGVVDLATRTLAEGNSRNPRIALLILDYCPREHRRLPGQGSPGISGMATPGREVSIQRGRAYLREFRFPLRPQELPSLLPSVRFRNGKHSRALPLDVGR